MDTSAPDPVGVVAGDGGVPCSRSSDCDDLDPCNGVETCVSRVCAPGEPIVCPSDGCLVGVCNAGQCSKKPSAAACSDGVGCTVDTCDAGSGVCSHTLDNTRCDDGLSCTRDICLGQAIGVISSGCYSVPDDSLCEQPTVPNACATMACAPSARAPDDVTGCVPRLNGICGDVMRCDLTTLQCVHLPDSCTGCDDGIACNGVEQCVDLGGGISSCTRSVPPCQQPTDACKTTVCDLSSLDVSCATVPRITSQCIGPIAIP